MALVQELDVFGHRPVGCGELEPCDKQCPPGLARAIQSTMNKQTRARRGQTNVEQMEVTMVRVFEQKDL